jgi:hypothetical protein
MYEKEYFAVLKYLKNNKDFEGVDLHNLLEELFNVDTVGYVGDINDLKSKFLEKMKFANDISYVLHETITASDFKYNPNKEIHTWAHITRQGEKYLLNRKSRKKNFLKELFKPELVKPPSRFILFLNSRIGALILSIIAGALGGILATMVTSYFSTAKTSPNTAIISSRQLKSQHK